MFNWSNKEKQKDPSSHPSSVTVLTNVDGDPDLTIERDVESTTTPTWLQEWPLPSIHAIQLDRLGTSPYLAWTSSILCLLASAKGFQGAPGWPSFSFAALSTGAFALSGLAVHKDVQDGPSIATAWSIISYSLLFKDLPWKQRTFVPKCMSIWFLASTGLYAKETAESFF